jgi:hypothetical protein
MQAGRLQPFQQPGQLREPGLRHQAGGFIRRPEDQEQMPQLGECLTSGFLDGGQRRGGPLSLRGEEPSGPPPSG